MTTDLFAEDLSAIDEVDPSKDYHEELVGEGKKYADNKALAYSRIMADNHIKKLEGEQAALRRELEARMNMEKFLTELNAAKSQLSNPEPQIPGDQPTDDPAITPEQLEQLVAAKLKQFEAQKTAEQNTGEAMRKLRETFGPNYAHKVRELSEDLGMTEAEVKALAARNPKALYKLFGMDGEQPREMFSAPPRTQSFALPTPPKKGYSWYWKNVYQNPERGPTEFYSSKVQSEMEQAMNTMGKEAFLNS